MFDFRDCITSSDPTSLSIELWDTYKRVKNDPHKRQAKYIAKDREDHDGVFEPNVNLSNIKDFIRVYKGMESARNSGVSKIGTLCNQMVQHTCEQLGLRVKPEHKLIENSQRRAIDIFLPDISTYVSVTTTPRERKRGDWQHELDQLLQLSKMGQIPSDWRFVGLMFEGTMREPKRIQDELRQASERASVVMVKDIESHSNFLIGLCQRNLSSRETTQTSLQRSPSCTPPAIQRSLI